MDRIAIGRLKPLLISATGALAVCAMLMLTWASSAHASYPVGERHFCWGKTLGSTYTLGGFCSAWTNDNLVGYTQAVGGKGDQHSVCVGVQPKIGTVMCSGGPGQGVYNNSMGGSLAFPFIENNAVGNNKVYGTAWFVKGPEESPPPPPPAPAWHSEHVAGNMTMNPAIAAPYPSSLNLVSRGSDGALYYKTGLESTGWSEWAQVAGGTGSVASSPSASSWGEGRLDIAARMSDNSIKHWYWTGSAWNSEKIAGNMRGTPAIVDVDPGHIDLVAQGSDNALYYRDWYQASGWTEWAPLGSGTGAVSSSPAATSWGTGRFDVVARASNNSVNHWYWDGSWHSENIAGNVVSDPALSTSDTGRLDLVARGTDNYLYRRAWEAGTGWTAWELLAGGAGPVPDGVAMVSPYSTRLDVVARDSDNSVDHWFWK